MGRTPGRIGRGLVALNIVFASMQIAPVLAASLDGPVTFGSPDQTYGVRRAVTAADRAAIHAYRSGQRPIRYSTTFSDPAELDRDWIMVSDDNASLLSCRRPTSVQAARGLRIRTLVANDCRAQWSTGYLRSRQKFSTGFFEASIRIADIQGLNNAFWLVTDDHFEIDVCENRYPSYDHIALQYWPVGSGQKHSGVGFGANFVENLATAFHDYGVLIRPNDMIFEVDGEPVAAVVTNQMVRGPADIRFSTALANWAGGPPPEHPEGHDMVVKSFRAYDP